MLTGETVLCEKVPSAVMVPKKSLLVPLGDDPPIVSRTDSLIRRVMKFTGPGAVSCLSLLVTAGCGLVLLVILVTNVFAVIAQLNSPSSCVMNNWPDCSWPAIALTVPMPALASKSGTTLKKKLFVLNRLSVE